MLKWRREETGNGTLCDAFTESALHLIACFPGCTLSDLKKTKVLICSDGYICKNQYRAQYSRIQTRILSFVVSPLLKVDKGDLPRTEILSNKVLERHRGFLYSLVVEPVIGV